LSAELESDLERTRGRMTELNARVTALSQAALLGADELDSADTQRRQQAHQTESLEQQLQAAIRRLAELRSQMEADKAGHLEEMRQAARLQNDVVSYKAHMDNLRREYDRLRLRSEQAAEHLASLDIELKELTEADEALQSRLGGVRQNLA